MAPEIILRGDKYNHQVDVWSIGIITFQILMGFYPFMTHSKSGFFSSMRKGEIKIPELLHLSNHAIHFINSCLQQEPLKRIHFSELLEHRWFTTSDEEILASVKALSG